MKSTFLRSPENSQRCCRRGASLDHCGASFALARTQELVPRRRHTRFIKRKSCFFRRSVVIRSAVLAIRAGTVPTSPSHQWLGGQHGEEAKDEDEGSGEEGCEEGQTEKEEVGICRSQSSTSTDVDDCVTRAGGCRSGLALRDRIRQRRLQSTTEGVGETRVRASSVRALRMT